MAQILVVDDEEGLREFLAEALQDDGHAVATAANGEEALKLLAERSYQLMLTDLKMPGMDGITLVRKARRAQPELEVIVLTAFGSVETAVEAMKLGAYDYLQKPISSPSELRLLAARALERRSLLALKDRVRRDDASVPPLSYGDEAMERVVAALKKVARTDATVLLSGESGTGKEIAARALHRWSRRSDGPFVAINCAALSETLLESELFGHEKGAFTGASSARRGRIELADGGTFFLDEVGELKPGVQAKLLRALQERCFERVGGVQTVTVDVRIIAATNRDLGAMVDEGSFREDLYHRLALFPVELPPLRERRSDIMPLAATLLDRIGHTLGRPNLKLSDEAARALLAAEWRGNVRELANALERAAILADGDTLSAADLSFGQRRRAKAGSGTQTLEVMEREAIERALAAVDGNRRKAAEQLGIGLRTLYDKLKRHGLS